MLRAVQVGGKAAVVLRAARRVDDDSRLFPGGGFAQTLITVVLGLVVVQLFLVADAAVAALHPHIHAVLGGSSLHGEKGIGGFSLQSLVDGGSRAAFLGLDWIVLRYRVGAAHKDHTGVVQDGLCLCGGKGALLHAVFGGLLKALAALRVQA